jgi:hypothetical protein
MSEDFVETAKTHNSIVADGGQRLRKDPRYHQKVHEAREAIFRRYETQLVAAGSLKRMLLLAKMWWETRETLALERNLYLRKHNGHTSKRL